ncbi:MAG: glutamate--cysteine ligase [SAR86 cluster bacterium]|uniref:Glutamate--cysteine ligase n=1 Tax=SAR86 cluster bacterium TaxID=2030880 RepID=A0A2A5B9N1_9GAMM|nr:MAG: glutamate--cysteine ligase [SAR86 cluster bacterium]
MSKQFNESLVRYQLPEFESEWGIVHRGIEKESLRVLPSGHISQSSHPLVLGSTLTNPFITTDFSEALLEFITPAYGNIDECLQVLENTHRFTLQNLENDEMLWVASMPCPMGSENEIPIAQYGSSNIGKLKTLYRHGLSNRYGSLMQAIAGIHYNFSMPVSFWQPYQKISGHQGSLQEFQTQKYLHLIRNFHRYSWLLVYLFGASPAACKCFVQGREHSLQELDEHTLYLPYATCLRMGNLGYKSEAQKSLFVCYNELSSYADCLNQAMHTPYAEYEALGQSRDGEYIQINTNLLQLENEFYSTIRPKRNVKDGQRPLQALTEKGIEYIEVRALDLNPYLPLGIDAEQIRFLDTFLLHCLLSESPECHEQEFFEVSSNLALVVEQGRDPKLELQMDGASIRMTQWANELIEDLAHSASMFDHIHGGNNYEKSLAVQAEKVANPELTPSGRILKDMKEGQMSFFEFSMQQSRAHQAYFKNNELSSEVEKMMRDTASASLLKQKEIEAQDSLNFDEFLADWNNT